MYNYYVLIQNKNIIKRKRSLASEAKKDGWLFIMRGRPVSSPECHRRGASRNNPS
jgi:hypothetical protein